ncbi:MAG TPA: acVLRF1 family peptidyl-tRNA hydrolase [Kribbellaceae bacterium]
MAEAKVVRVSPQRVLRWLEGFAARHGEASYEISAQAVVATAPDGSVARVVVPFPPLAGDTLADLDEHVRRERRTAVLLVRRGGYGAGVFDGTELVASKVGSRHVQGTTKAGGWSQQRYARRRENQAREAFGAAADAAERVLVPYRDGLVALFCGGDRRAVDAVLADPRLSGLAELVRDPFLAVPDPRQRVLEKAGADALAVRIEVNEPLTHDDNSA